MRTRWINKNVLFKSKILFFFDSFIVFSKIYLSSLLLNKDKFYRSSTYVKKNYDNERYHELSHFKKNLPSFDHYIFGKPNDYDFTLISDKITFADIRLSRVVIASIICERIGSFLLHNPKSVVVEFGSGNGRNILMLKRLFPDAHFIGLELSPESINLSNAAASAYGLDVAFYQADITKAIPNLNKEVSLCFSVHALEQIPRSFYKAVDNMLCTSSDTVCLFEPIHELYPKSLRGFLSFLRAKVMDRLSGLKSYVENIKGVKISHFRLKYADNPFNETCFIELKKVK